MKCPICGSAEFFYGNVLWPELIEAWQLSPVEVEYINRQQGMCCRKCGNNLRAMALASSVVNIYGKSRHDTLLEVCSTVNEIAVLEINRAANLTPVFQRMPKHRLVEYPEFDMQALNLASSTYDLVIHSDTLEHVPNPVRGLAECRRVLKPEGFCLFTIPIIVDRMSRNRRGLAASYHGSPNAPVADQIVHTEFGVDFWKIVIEAGFSHCAIQSFDFPAAMAIIAKP